MLAPVRRPRRPRERLASLNDNAPIPAYKSTTRQSPPSALEPPESVPKDQCCDEPIFSIDEDGPQVCENCGRLKGNESGIVAEITFGETASGAAIVQGGFVGEEQRHANTMGGTMRGLGGMESREKTLWNGKDEIARLCVTLRIHQKTNDVAVSLYKLALAHNFVQGRRIRNVAACCIYLADRRERESTLLLMDLAEKIQVNIWTLGKTYKEFLNVLMEQDPAGEPGREKVTLQLEPLVLKFCKKLEFEPYAYRVAEDACNLIKRMRRDWMVEGRQPAGIIGAAIILAARMNNFRRTVREVVYVVKVADSTLNQRLYEFKRTKASGLTVDQFRRVGLRVKDDIQPPSVYRRQEKEEKKRKRAALASGEEDALADAEVVASSNSSSKKPRKVIKKRKTSNGAAQPTASEGQSSTVQDDGGFGIPEIPLPLSDTPQDAMDFESEAHLQHVAAVAAPEAQVEVPTEDASPLPKKRGRPPKKRQPIVIASEDLEIEAEIEGDMKKNIHEWERIFKEFNSNENHPVLRSADIAARALAREHMPFANVSNTEDIDDEEFADDEDVMNCQLTPTEVAMKEKVWITENEDWLREQQAKLMAKELEEASGKRKKVKHRRARTQMGDGSVLGGKPADSPADAAHSMLQKRSNFFSSHLNYKKLQELFPNREAEEESQGTTPTDSGTGAQDTNSGTAAQNTQDQEEEEEEIVEIVDGDAEGEYVEEYDEEAYEETYDEPYDDTHMYLSDEDVGFENLDDDF